MAGALGRITPPDFEHVSKFPLLALAATERPVGVPVVAGVNWYTEFDSPVKGSDGRYWVARDGRLTSIRGGHCFCIKANENDPITWWRFYDQGQEGACVGFGDSRAKSLLDRVRYDAFEAYHATQALGGYVGQEGAFVRDCMELMRTRGLVRMGKKEPDPASKISTYRWVTTVDDVIASLNLPLAKKLGAVPFLNSWGDGYPHIVWMPGEVLQRLINEDGEVAIVTDL